MAGPSSILAGLWFGFFCSEIILNTVLCIHQVFMSDCALHYMIARLNRQVSMVYNSLHNIWRWLENFLWERICFNLHSSPWHKHSWLSCGPHCNSHPRRKLSVFATTILSLYGSTNIIVWERKKEILRFLSSKREWLHSDWKDDHLTHSSTSQLHGAANIFARLELYKYGTVLSSRFYLIFYWYFALSNCYIYILVRQINNIFGVDVDAPDKSVKFFPRVSHYLRFTFLVGTTSVEDVMASILWF